MVDREVLPPYIISSDAECLLRRWAHSMEYDLPSATYFQDLKQDLQNNLTKATNTRVDIVTEEELRMGLQAYLVNETSPIISLDRAYINEENTKVAGFIDITRAVKADFTDIGLHPRPGYPTFARQIQLLKLALGPQPVTLVDDVIFSGEGVLEITNLLEKQGIVVKRVIAGIVIGEGQELIQDSADIEVVSVKTYGQVYDEVCQRDFMAGIPLSGRTVISGNDSWSAPYFSPFGHPEKWASIPASAAQKFSRFCLEQSLDVWGEIESIQNESIPAFAVPRRLSTDNSLISITKLLKQHLEAA